MRRLFLYAWPVLLLLAVVGWTRLRIDTEIENTLGRHVPAVDAWVEIRDQFHFGDRVRVMLCTRDAEAELPTEAVERLRAMIRGSSKLAALGVTARPGPEAAARQWVMQQLPRGRAWLDKPAIDELIRRVRPEAMAERFQRHRNRLATPQPAEVTRAMLRDPLALRELIPERLTARGIGGANRPNAARPPAEDTHDTDPLAGRRNDTGSAWLVQLGVPFPTSRVAQAQQLQAALSEIAESVRAAYPGLELHAAGPPLLAAESARRVRAEAKVTVLVAVLGIAVVFALTWRRARPIGALLVTTGASLLTAFGLYGLTGWPLSPLAALSGGMLAGLGVDYGIHVLNEVRRADHPHGESTDAATVSRRLARPIVTACATTTCGFLALAATEPAALVQLALLGSLGLACAALGALTLLPALAGLTGAHTPPQPDTPPRPLRWAAARSGWMSLAGGIGLGVLLLAVLFTRGAPNNGRLLDLHPQPNAAIDAQDTIAARFGQSAGSVLLLITADTPSKLHQRLEQLHALPIPFDITSAASLLPPPGRDAAIAQRLAVLDPEAVKQRVITAAERAGFHGASFEPAGEFLERLLQTPSPGLAALAASDQGGLLFPEPFDPAAPRTVAVLTPTRSWETHEMRSEDLEVLQRALADVPGVRATGLDVIGEAMRQGIPGDLARALAWSTVPILLLLGVVLRDARRVAMAVTPPAVGMLAAVLAQQLGSGQWNPVNLAAIPLLLGIGVDAGLLLGDAAARGSVGGVQRRLRGVHLTLLTTLVGFGSLSLTSIPAVRELGWMVIAGLGGVLVVTWLIALRGLRDA